MLESFRSRRLEGAPIELRNELLPIGRLSRGGFWLRHLTVLPLGLWAVIAAGHFPGAPYDAPLALALTLFLVSTWGRRLHDRGRSAWWLLVFLVPVLGALILFIECACRGTSALAGERHGPKPGSRRDYLTVDPSPTP